MIQWGLIGLGVVVVAIVLVVTLTRGGGDDGPPTQAQLVDRGDGLFQKNCSSCHGDDLRGTFVGPPLIHELYVPDRLPDDAIRAAVANGVPPKNWDTEGMPVIGLPDDEVDAIIAYIRSTQVDAGLYTPTTTTPAGTTAG